MFSAMRHHQNVDLDIDGNASKPHISIFDENEIFAKICLDTISVNGLYRVQSL